MLQFAKASILTCNTWVKTKLSVDFKFLSKTQFHVLKSNSRHVCLLSDDRLMVYQGLQMDDDNTSLDPNNWETIQIPSVYIMHNWPITVICGYYNEWVGVKSNKHHFIIVVHSAFL